MKKETVVVPTMIGELLEVIHNALLVVDSSHKIIFANSRTAKMFSTAPDALLGQSISTLFMPEDVNVLVHNILSFIRMNREIESEAMFLKRDGTTFLGRISGTCFEWAENQEGMVFSIHDISDMKEIEQSLKRSERVAFLGRLVDDISHQIRNPIMAIGGLARLLQSNYGTSSNVEIILHEASRLEKLLNTMNRFAELPRPKTERVQFSDLLNELEMVVGVEVQKLGCTWSCRCSDLLLDKNLLIDKGLFLAAIIDVARNSCESYIEADTEEEKLVQCDIYPSENDAFPFTVKITDSGAGIAKHAKEHVFSHFYTAKTGHIGMGLTFVKRIIEEQGGLVTIESKPGHGTIVSFHLIKERRRDFRTRRIAAASLH